MEKIYIIGFGYEIKDVHKHKEFMSKTNEAATESLILLSRKPDKYKTAPIIDIRKLYIPENSENKEYDDYSSVYYMNEAALAMCQEIGLELNIIGNAVKLTDSYNYQLQAQYFPISER